nr:S53 family peptidase [Chromobacterium sp. ASV5]
MPKYPLAAGFLIASLSASWAHAAAWSATGTQAHPVQSLIPGAKDNGEVAPGQLVHISVSLAVRDKAGLESLANAVMAGDASKVLSDEQFMARFAPTASQVQQVISHLQANGFRNIQASDNRLLISADGSAATVKSAFQTSLHRYTLNGRAATANIGNAMVPQALSGIVLAVHGLQDAHQFALALHSNGQVGAQAKTASVSAHKPTDFQAIYNAASLPAAGNTAVGIIAEGDVSRTLADLQTFAKSAGFAAPATAVIHAGASTSDTSGLLEWNLDSQSILATAGGKLKQLQFYVAPSMNNADITAAINAAVSANSAKVINISLGECELSAQMSGMTASTDQLFAAGVVKGQTFVVSSGDSGAYECGGGTPLQSYPAVSPYVVAAGGTTLNANGASYLSETVWSGAGGGPSYTEAAPAWQTSAGVLTSNKTRRGVPDIAFDADPYSGALVLLSGNTYQVGGTSLAAPLFSGFWARIQSAHGNGLISPSAAIYKYFKANPSLYHDVTSGSNGAYRAASGWDYASGWGSLNIANFNAFVSKTAGF